MTSLLRLLFCSIIVFFTFQANAQLEIKDGTAPLPDFRFYTLEGREYTQNDFKFENFGLVIFYSPKCSHCIDQIKVMKESWDKFHNIPILFITQNTNTNIKAFKEKYFKDNKNCVFVNDVERTLFEKFVINKAPTIFIYNKDKKLIATASESPASDIYQFWNY